ncbi:type II toxin-antitoxin system prevent-host-death family antitoxin [Nocardia brevicatena]|uniref:type II toxin-antitoxin system prevent-host-death family antitoxin n=1 Tax=Nocardia brevicatena TaxID=37327 RepID=UPI0012FAE59B|nr:type II toxin-antitoxin system prevent-host-death family antitoxin [Nocardia brevicatena]
MSSISVSFILGIPEARARLSAVVNAAAQDGHVTVITGGGEPAAAVILVVAAGQRRDIYER